MMKKMFQRMISSSAPTATILLRLLVGIVFVSEGIQKFLFPEEVGAGRFTRIGMPMAETLAPIVGVVEIVCGSAVLFGLFTRFAVIPLIVIMIAAIVSTKVPVLLGTEFLGFTLRKVSYYGVWGFLHESRTDLSMLACSLFLLLVGAGGTSVDKLLIRKSEESAEIV